MRPTLLLLPLLVSSLLQFHRRAIADCEPAACGNLTLAYPFWLGNSSTNNSQPPPSSLCGHPAFEVLCGDDGRVASLKGSSIHVLGINYTTSSFVACHAKLAGADAVCRADFNMSSSIALSPFTISAQNRALCFLYNCRGTAPSGPEYANATSSCGTPIYAYLAGVYNWDRTPAIATGSCEFISYMPVLGSEAAVMTAANYSRLLKDGFVLDWEAAYIGDCGACNATGGQCRYDTVAAEFWCLCTDGRRSRSTCARGYKTRSMVVGIVCGVGGSSLLIVYFFLIWRKQRKQARASNGLLRSEYPNKCKTNLNFFICNKIASATERNIEALILLHGTLAPKRYKYSEATKITSSLNNKLGEGGYGMVFKGRLDDGRLVAVKFLHESKGEGEEFVNEVMSIGRTSHVNIVSLFGFCLEGSKRALIYEYMPNGSLDKYIYSENPKAVLGWDKLYMIAIGIARGLEYLHHSCNTRIVHFDIKPQNILLDEDFHPKIADFGLAKLCHTKESKLSMTGARGTVGFIAPEVHSRTFGVVSAKSDVYSYGMMLLEMVGGRKNVKSVAQESSQKYFPHWIYDHFGQDDGLQACEVTNENEGIAKKMSVIGLWCIQILPMHRPTIGKVLEMFERGLDDLDMPPRQNFSQILEDSAYNFNAENMSTSSGTKTFL